MLRYRLRYFFSPGSGVCLWAANDASRDRFDYAIEFDALPFSEQTRQAGIALCDRWDTSIDWDYPPNPSPWSESEKVEFYEAAEAWLLTVQQELGQAFEVINELDKFGR